MASMASDQQDQWRALLREVMAGMVAEPIISATRGHFDVVVQEAFKAAKWQLRILTGPTDLSWFSDPDIVRFLVDFASRPETTLEIIFRPESLPPRSLELALRAASEDRAVLRLIDQATSVQAPYQFILVDNSAYRYQRDINSMESIVAGGASYREQADRLSEIFSHLLAVGAGLDGRT
jgi:hypothetical protein